MSFTKPKFALAANVLCRMSMSNRNAFSMLKYSRICLLTTSWSCSHLFNLLRVNIRFSINGDLRLWDIRMKESFKVINTAPGLTAIDVHQHAELIAWSVQPIHSFMVIGQYGPSPLSLVSTLVSKM